MQDITSLVVQSIQNQLPNIPVFTEDMSGGAFVEPSFFVSRIGITASPGISTLGYGERSYAFDVAYFPDPSGNMNQDMDNMTEWLVDNLRDITDEDGSVFACATNREFSITDQVLHYSFYVPVYSYEPSGPKFDESQTLETKGELLDGN
jgi:hypothetical protein